MEILILLLIIASPYLFYYLIKLSINDSAIKKQNFNIQKTLLEIRDELRINNELLRKQQSQSSDTKEENDADTQ